MYTAMIAGQSIDVGNISIPFRLKNPMFDPSGGMEWNATYPFRLPATPRNKYILGFPNRFTAKKTSVDYPFDHWMDGVRLPGDTIRVTESNSGEFTAYIRVGRSDFISKNKDKKLTDLAFERMHYQAGYENDPLYFYDGMTKAYPDIPFALLPVLNPGLFKNTHMATWWTDSAQNGFGPYQNLCYKIGTMVIFNKDSFTPFPYLVPVLDKIFTESGYQVDRNLFSDDPELSQLCIYNPNRCLFFEDQYMTDYAEFSLSDHLPQMLITTFFTNLRVPFGVDAYFKHATKAVSLISRKDIIRSTDFVDWSKGAYDPNVFIEKEIENFNFSMKPPGSDDYYSNMVKDLDSYKTSVKISASFLVDLPAFPDVKVGTLGYVIMEDTYYVMDYFPESNEYGWRFVSINLFPFKAGTDFEFSIEGDISPLLSSRKEFLGFVQDPWVWAMPETDQAGNFGQLPLTSKCEYADFGLRLLFSRGIHTVTPGISYRLGSSFNYSFFPVVEVGNPKYSLRWDGDNDQYIHKNYGLYETFWKDWFTWRKTSKPFEFQKQFTALDLLNLDFSKKHFMLNTMAILDEINFTVTNDGIKSGKVKAWTV